MRSIDLDYFKHWFKEYVAQFYTSSGNGTQPILLKKRHTERTCKEIGRLCRELGLTDETLVLAETTALFHDIGRFPQWRDYGTFVDSESKDHALLGLEVLSANGLLSGISPEKREIVLEAIRHHNVKELPSGMGPNQLLCARLLRDADKLDIWRVIIMQRGRQTELASVLDGNVPVDSSYSSQIIATLKAGKVADFSAVKNQNDMKLLRLGWIFDLNFAPSCRLVLKRRYIEKLCRLLPAVPEIQELKEYLISHLKNRIGTV